MVPVCNLKPVAKRKKKKKRVTIVSPLNSCKVSLLTVLYLSVTTKIKTRAEKKGGGQKQPLPKSPLSSLFFHMKALVTNLAFIIAIYKLRQ